MRARPKIAVRPCSYGAGDQSEEDVPENEHFHNYVAHDPKTKNGDRVSEGLIASWNARKAALCAAES